MLESGKIIARILDAKGQSRTPTSYYWVYPSLLYRMDPSVPEDEARGSFDDISGDG